MQKKKVENLPSFKPLYMNKHNNNYNFLLFLFNFE